MYACMARSGSSEPRVHTCGCACPRVQGVPLFFVSLGSTKDLSKWQEYTRFPAEAMLLDQQVRAACAEAGALGTRVRKAPCV